MLDLNISLSRADIVLVGHSATASRCLCSTIASSDVTLLEVLVESKGDVTLTHVFAVLNGINLALMNRAEIMRCILSLRAALIVDGSTS